MKKFVSFILFLILTYIFFTQSITYADSWPDTPSVACGGAVIMDASSGTVLFEKNMNSKFYPASITKIMATLVAIENSSLDETVTFSQRAINQIGNDSANLGMSNGEKITMKDALYGAMLKSANEYTNAFGEHIAGSIEGFVDMMNKKAKELGCKNTHFVTTNGLHDPDHYVTAYDMALIARAALNNKNFRKITGTKSYTIGSTNKTSAKRTFKNHHQMLVGGAYSNIYDGCIGGKTGYTRAASNTLVTYIKKGSLELVCVVLNNESSGGKPAYITQYENTKALVNATLSNFKSYNILENEGAKITKDFTSFNKYFNLDTKNNTGYISIAEDSCILLPKGVKYSDVKKEVKFFDNPKIQSGDNIIGKIQYTYGDRNVGNIDIIMKYYPRSKITSITLPDEMKKYSLLLDDASPTIIQKIGNILFNGFVLILLVVIILGIVFFIRYNSAQKRRHKAYRSRRNRSRMTFDNNKFI